MVFDRTNLHLMCDRELDHFKPSAQNRTDRNTCALRRVGCEPGSAAAELAVELPVVMPTFTLRVGALGGLCEAASWTWSSHWWRGLIESP